MEYRPIPESRLQELADIAQYAFYPTAEPGESNRVDDPSFQIGDPRALFDGEEMLAACRLLEFDARCRNEWITLGGLRGVLTPPEHRREGYASRVATDALGEFRERGVPLVALWPFDHGFYADLGWAPAVKHATYRLPPESLRPLASREAGRLFRPSVSEWERLQTVNLETGAGVSLSLRRTEEWWRHRIFERAGTKRTVYAWERDGEVEGYVVFSIEDEAGDSVLSVEELSAVDDRAFRHVCWLLYNHDSQVESIELPGNPDDQYGELLDRVMSPESVACELEHGAMVRMVDVPQALEAVQYPADLDATIVLDVLDDQADWNDSQYELTFTAGRVQCRRIEGGAGQADARVDVGTLSQLLVGYYPVETARRVGTLRLRSDTAATVLESVFPARPVQLSEFF